MFSRDGDVVHLQAYRCPKRQTRRRCCIPITILLRHSTARIGDLLVALVVAEAIQPNVARIELLPDIAEVRVQLLEALAYTTDDVKR